MTVLTDYEPGEIVRRGEQIYRERLQKTVEAGNAGRVLLIDITTGNYVFREEKNPFVASGQLRERNPDAVLYALRIGYPAVTKRGSWPTTR